MNATTTNIREQLTELQSWIQKARKAVSNRLQAVRTFDVVNEDIHRDIAQEKAVTARVREQQQTGDTDDQASSLSVPEPRVNLDQQAQAAVLEMRTIESLMQETKNTIDKLAGLEPEQTVPQLAEFLPMIGTVKAPTYIDTDDTDVYKQFALDAIRTGASDDDDDRTNWNDYAAVLRAKGDEFPDSDIYKNLQVLKTVPSWLLPVCSPLLEAVEKPNAVWGIKPLGDVDLGQLLSPVLPVRLFWIDRLAQLFSMVEHFVKIEDAPTFYEASDLEIALLEVVLRNIFENQRMYVASEDDQDSLSVASNVELKKVSPESRDSSKYIKPFLLQGGWNRDYICARVLAILIGCFDSTFLVPMPLQHLRAVAETELNQYTIKVQNELDEVRSGSGPKKLGSTSAESNAESILTGLTRDTILRNTKSNPWGDPGIGPIVISLEATSLAVEAVLKKQNEEWFKTLITLASRICAHEQLSSVVELEKVATQEAQKSLGERIDRAADYLAASWSHLFGTNLANTLVSNFLQSIQKNESPELVESEFKYSRWLKKLKIRGPDGARQDESLAVRAIEAVLKTSHSFKVDIVEERNAYETLQLL